MRRVDLLQRGRGHCSNRRAWQGAGRRDLVREKPAPLVSARRMLGDPQWLGQYLEYISRLQLQEAPAFNLAGECCPPAVSPAPLRAGLGGGGECPTASNNHLRTRATKDLASLCQAPHTVRSLTGASPARSHEIPVTRWVGTITISILRT